MKDNSIISSVDSDSTELCHLNMGYIGECSLKELKKRFWLMVLIIQNMTFVSYVLGKQTIIYFGTREHKFNAVLEYVRTDVWRSFPCSFLNGFVCFVPFIDDFFSQSMNILFTI